MRPLDAINPAAAKPSTFVPLGAFVPFLLGLIGIALANGTAPATPFLGNPLAIFSALISLLALALAATAFLLRWSWNARHFGASTFAMASIMMFWLVPILCVGLYSRLSLAAGVALLCGGALAHVLWCRRFIKYYQTLQANPEHWSMVYQEEADCVYYRQHSDNQLAETKYKFKQFPSAALFLVPMVAALALLPVMGRTSAFVGVPFTHIFLSLVAFPISLMGAGLAVRGWLTYYHYPSEIRKATGKVTYVDMSSHKKQ